MTKLIPSAFSAVRYALLFTFVLSSLALVRSLPAEAKINDGELSALNPSQGHKINQVNYQLITHDGFLWLGHQRGLSRFDGYQMIDIHGPDNLFTGHPIVYLFEDSHQQLWISDAHSGLFVLDLNTGVYSKMLSENLNATGKEIIEVNDIIELANGDLWLASGQHLRYFDRKNQIITSQFSLSDLAIEVTDKDSINRLMPVADSLYIGTSLGLLKTPLKSVAGDKSKPQAQLQVQLQTYGGADLSSKQKFVSSLHKIDDMLVIGTKAGLQVVDNYFAFKGQRTDKASYTTMLNQQHVKQILPHEGQYLLVTDHGLSWFDPLTKTTKAMWRFSDDITLGINHNGIANMVTDSQHNFWLATEYGGVYYWQPQQRIFTTIGAQNCQIDGLTHGQVWSLLPIDDNHLWAGTRNGLNKVELSSGKVSHYLALEKADSMSSSMMYKLLRLSANKILIVTGDPSQSLVLFNTQTEQIQPIPANDQLTQELLSEPLSGFYLHDGLLWFASESDFYQYDFATGIAKPLSHLSEQIDIENFTSFLGFHHNKLMIAAYRQLWLYNTQTTELEPIFEISQESSQKWSQELSDEDVSFSSWVVDDNQNLWLSMTDLGLLVLDANDFTFKHWFNQDNALPTNSVYGLQKDGKDHLWLSSDKGLLRLNLNKDISNDISPLQVKPFDERHGLLSHEFNGGIGVQPYAKLTNGYLAYGSNQGITTFNPRLLDHQQATPLEVKITYVDLLSRPLSMPPVELTGKAIELNYDDKGLQINFSTMRFSPEHQMQYSWSFDGKSTTSFPESGNNSVILPQLKPGNYQFNVMAVDTISGEKSTSKSLRVIVKPPFWATWWAYCVYGLLALAFVINRWQQHLRYKALVKAHHLALMELADKGE